MQDEKRVHEFTKEIGQLVLQDPKLAHGTWNAFSLVILCEEGNFINYGFVYDIKGRARPFRTELPAAELSKLQNLLPENNKHWQACRMEMKAANWEMTWEFEFDHPERFYPGSDLTEMATFLHPEFDADQFWYCPLSYNVLDKLKENSPELVADLGEENLHCMITNGFLKAMKYGFETRTDLAAFAMTCFEVAPNFDTHPAFLAAFAKIQDVPGSVWNLLYASVPEASWAQMKGADFYDGKAWFSELPVELFEEVA